MDKEAMTKLNDILSDVLILFPAEVEVPYLTYADAANKVQSISSDDNVSFSIQSANGSNVKSALVRALEFFNKYGRIGKNVIDGVPNPKCNSSEGCLKDYGACDGESDESNTDIELKGTGTWSDPYQINTVAELQQLAKNVDNGKTYAGEYIILKNNLDLSGISNFSSIGTENGMSTSIFAGTFDGDNFTISGLNIKSEKVGSQGLFTALNTNAVVKNLKVKNAKIEATPDFDLKVGIIAGDIKKQANVSNCHVSGTIVAKSSSEPLTVGGIVGNMALKSEVVNCSSDVTITLDIMEGVTVDAGGISGLTKMNAKVLNCSANGTITAKDDTLVNAGGIVGNAMGISDNVVSYMKITTNGKAGIILGVADDFGTYANIYSNNGSASAMGNKSEKAKTTFTAEDLIKNISALHRTYPKLEFYKWVLAKNILTPSGEQWHETAINESIFDGGKGTETDPYRIATKDQLVAFANSLEEEILYDEKYISLTADIDISDIANWQPIGGSQFSFNGNFNGNNHVVKGLKEGTKENPRQLSTELADFSNALGFFGTLGVNAVVKNLHLRNVAIYAYRKDASFVGGIVGYMQGLSDTNSSSGALIDHCSVEGIIESTTAEKNAYVGGIASRQYKGAIINSYANVDLSCKVEYGTYVAAVGGITGMTNRGLIANCYATGKIFGSMPRDIENDIEGMSSVGSVVGVDAGDLVNSYAIGDTISEHYSVYTGAITGWVTGIGKAYQSYFDIDKTMYINGRKETEVQPYGTQTVGGVNEEYQAYEGGVIFALESFNTATYKDLPEKLNDNFEHFGINLAKYNLNNNSLRTWAYDNGVVTFTDKYTNVTYIQPEEEKIEAKPLIMQDGVWYGRDSSGAVTVKITVENDKVTKEEILTGSKDDKENYQKALSRAMDKAIYGDKTGYGKGDASKFSGGLGIKEEPYQVGTEEQLRYIAEAINADETWENIYFEQIADIKLTTTKDWHPIGFAIKAKIKGDPVIYSAYPFRGSYNGNNYKIIGLTIGSRTNPASIYTAAMFGFTGGDYESNLTYGDETLKVELNNIRLRDVYINNEVPYDTYTAGLVGTGQNGVFIDNCSVKGKISVKADDIASRAAGLASSMLRGLVTNSYTNVTINAITEEGDVYAGGLYSVTNRINTINCYALGNVFGSANTNSKVHIGGIVGMNGAFQYNCYAYGNITSNKPAIDVGVSDGRIANVAYDHYCYYNMDAQLIENGVVVESKFTGMDGTGSSKDVTFGKTKAEIGSQSFADVLNENKKNVTEQLAVADEELGGIMSIYYDKGPDGLFDWVIEDGIAVFDKKNNNNDDPSVDSENEDPTSNPNTKSSGTNNNNDNINTDNKNKDSTTIDNTNNEKSGVLSKHSNPLLLNILYILSIILFFIFN
ncbi:hypothetical protein PIROE2DRAFT_58322 [Piromyces sp. E2]|nr:hypothetical protein PIROE2DRAFT_58322 [Piromyces sp. E2]|eukprot:OUM68154.1 hypothetical protein PIROE2DRAFT_58322 [Piromyces sp. E2]